MKKIAISLLSPFYFIFNLFDSFYLSKGVKQPQNIGHSDWLNYLVQIGNKEGIRILEVGSREVTGNSFARSRFDKAEYVGFDYYGGNNVDVVGDVHRLSSYFNSDEKFDIIFTSACFEHFAMPWIASVEMTKMLKVGGYIMVETHFSFGAHELPWNFFQFSNEGLRALFPENLGIECLDYGMSNPIVGRFSSNADKYLRNRPIRGLYCHSEFLGRKIKDVPDFNWSNLNLLDVVGDTEYPRPKECLMKFWLTILLEGIFAPILYLFNEFKNRISSQNAIDQFESNNSTVHKINRIAFVVHEWAGYPLERTKQIKPFLAPFKCGLKNQLESLIHYRKNFQKGRPTSYFLTISDFSDAYVKMLENINLPIGFFEKIPVSNIGMDFSGYGHIIRNKLEESNDDLVFLINSSVSGNFSDKIEDYIKAFELNQELGLLGVSYSTKIYQTLIRNNFRPHVQSFFMVARASVLVKILKNNNLVFPGENETNKYSIIRFGEAKLTKLTQDLGFQVGVVETDGQLHLLPQATVFNNYFNSWRLPHGDRRLSNGLPNYVHKLKL